MQQLLTKWLLFKFDFCIMTHGGIPFNLEWTCPQFGVRGVSGGPLTPSSACFENLPKREDIKSQFCSGKNCSEWHSVYHVSVSI